MDAAMYERALSRTRKVVAGTSKDQLDDPTPCSEWKVRDVLEHIIGGCLACASGARGKTGSFDQGKGATDGDFVAAFDEASEDAVAAFEEPGALEKGFAMEWGETPGSAVLGLALADAAVHGWDLAKGTNQDYEIDDDVARAAYGMVTSMMQPEGDYPRGESFGDPIEVPDDAPIPDKLLAYLGRTP